MARGALRRAARGSAGERRGGGGGPSAKRDLEPKGEELDSFAHRVKSGNLGWRANTGNQGDVLPLRFDHLLEARSNHV